MPEITLTDAEREKLLGVAYEVGWYLPGHDTVEDLVGVSLRMALAALSAVPRLALASPVVGELVALVRYAAANAETHEEEADILRRLAALTGEEGRDA